MKQIKLLFVTLSVLLFVAATPDKRTTIFVIGDSTAANKDTSGGKQERGWAMLLQPCFDADYIVVDNHAVNGRSSKSFINEGRWDKVLEIPIRALPSTITWRSLCVRHASMVASLC